MRLGWILCLAAVVAIASAARPAAEISKQWHWLGPLPSGKTEFEGDPLAAGKGGVHAHYFENKTGFSEYTIGGILRWSTARVDGNGFVNLPHDHVHWQPLQQQPPTGQFNDIDVRVSVCLVCYYRAL